MNLIKKESISGDVLSMTEKEAIESFETASSEGRILSSDEAWKKRIEELAGMSHTELT